MNKAREAIAGLLKLIFKPKESVLPSVWVEREIRLDAKTSNKAGRYSLLHTPYLRQLYDDVANPRIRKIILKKSAQVGATQFANNVLLFYACNFAFPSLMIMPSKESAQQFCERSLTPSIYGCKAIKPFLTGNDDDLKKTEFLFKSSIVRVIGAGSPSKLASNPACLCIIDEADKMEDFASQGEAPALELAEDRTISFPNDKKILILSTPTAENTSVVHSQYLLGSQSKFFVSCPQCSHEQTLIFEQIHWPAECKVEEQWDLDKVERETYYECASCKARLTEHDKLSMVRGGRWKDTNLKPFPAEIRSYHISALYSFNVPWGSLAKLFLLAKAEPGKLRNFYNSYLGECFENRAATIGKTDIDELIKASPKYLKGELLKAPEALLMACDTQGDCFWYAVEALYLDGTSSVIDWGRAETFQDLNDIFRRPYRIKGGEEVFQIARALIDLRGNRTTEVKDFCASTGFRFVGVMGSSREQGLFAPVREKLIPHKQFNVPVMLIDDKNFKDVLYLYNIKGRSGKLFLPQDSNDELKLQLSSERLVERKGKTEWICTNRNNHLGDCLKYISGMIYLLQPTLERKQRQKEAGEQTATEPQLRQYSLNTEVRKYAPSGWD